MPVLLAKPSNWTARSCSRSRLALRACPFGSADTNARKPLCAVDPPDQAGQMTPAGEAPPLLQLAEHLLELVPQTVVRSILHVPGGTGVIIPMFGFLLAVQPNLRQLRIADAEERACAGRSPARCPAADCRGPSAGRSCHGPPSPRSSRPSPRSSPECRPAAGSPHSHSPSWPATASGSRYHGTARRGGRRCADPGPETRPGPSPHLRSPESAGRSKPPDAGGR